ncbi:Short-chain dehydrogenase TIC 32 [Colletotrichum orbiculare MAFF 240422]|uniref:Short-chain dehydrogenase TIC 32 n=1 Tax=Colletotrichum orbiculare (strain 104-T / ATCC 96160 / CBS 514.97 / LARS 414 / MAFF 240422) TaxID=1213857 RepID=N4VWC2_COLOR|nr:Short-chain dehydrogenase TIC 32 [Colletotrichum orbiculare MAFF 240422]
MSRYAAAHANPSGPGDARPTALQIVDDENLRGKLRGRVAVITGVSSGIGIETVRAIAATGATLYLTARDLTKARNALGTILDAGRMHLVEMDQESFASVRKAAAAILAKTSKINLLINNAGIMSVPDLRLTKDGHELQFGTNHLSHFLFFQLLKPALLAAATTADYPSRVVNVSSAAHRISSTNASDNYNFQRGGYDPQLAYGQSKTANIHMANEIDRRYAAPSSGNLRAYSLHPGVILTPLSKFMPAEQVASMAEHEKLRNHLKSPAQGAATSVLAALGKEWAGRGGVYLDNCAETALQTEEVEFWESGVHAAHAFDRAGEERLWRDSLRIVGLEDDR